MNDTLSRNEFQVIATEPRNKETVRKLDIPIVYKKMNPLQYSLLKKLWKSKTPLLYKSSVSIDISLDIQKSSENQSLRSKSPVSDIVDEKNLDNKHKQ